MVSPQECFEYRLGNRSVLEWVIDQYQLNEDKHSGIVSDPSQLDDEEYIVRLIAKVVTVSIETVQLVNELAQAVQTSCAITPYEDKMRSESSPRQLRFGNPGP